MCHAYIEEDAVGVDCTCGNGYDTLWLAERCKKVYSFDIQEEALESAGKLLAEYDKSNVIFIKDSHEYIKKYVEESPSVILFNLGFLPSGDKEITTKADTSLKAIKVALEILTVGGLISITLYPGHEEGKRELDLILEWAKGLDSKTYHCVFANMINQSDRAPQVLWITKKR